jgi:DNA modification methylase
MSHSTQILVETTRKQKNALASVLRESGETLTEWFTDNIAEATAEFAGAGIETPHDLRNLDELGDSGRVIRELRELDWAFADDDTTYLSHDIHPYPAKFVPQIPRNLIARLSLPGESVWDPFGGSGTTALESVLLGRQAVSSDVNPLAEVIGKAKLLTLTKEDDDFLGGLAEELFIVSASEASVAQALNQLRPLERYMPYIPNAERWFHAQAWNELAYLKGRIKGLTSEKCRRLATVCLSKIVLKASFQDSETRYARCQKDFPPGKVIRLFAGSLGSSLKKVRYLGTILRFREATFLTADLRRQHVVQPCSVDLIVTSPPYPNANDYHLYHRFRLFWLGVDPRELARKEIGSHLRHQNERTGIKDYLAELEECLRNMLGGLRPGRFAVMVIGDSLFERQVHHTAGLVAERAGAVGFNVVGEIERELPRHRRSFMSTARRLRSESLLVLRKPMERVAVHIHPPPYRLWRYEADIRREEIRHLVGGRLCEGLGDVFSLEISPLQVDRLRRLTFSHSFVARNLHREPTWQAVLENGDAANPGARKDPKYVTHGIHDYKGKFYPQLARSLFNLAELAPGQRVMDPFCGSGTVPLETYLNGLEGFGFDMNPLAVKIAKAKTEVVLLDPYLRDRLLHQFQQRLAGLRPGGSDWEVFPVGARPEIESWFPERVVCKLAVLLRAIRETPEARVKEFLEVLLSSIVRDVSQQDPEDLRVRRRATPIEDAPVIELFGERLAEQRQRLGSFAQRSNRAPCRFLPARIFLADSREPGAFARAGIAEGTIDAVVTSPPYATALPYIDTDRLSILLLCGMGSGERSNIEEALTGSREIRNADRRAIEQRIENNDFGAVPSDTARGIVRRVYELNKRADVGFRRKNMASLLYRYFADMTRVMVNLNSSLKAGGAAFVVVGDNTTVAGGEEIVIKSSVFIQETATRLRWTTERVIPITVTKDNRPHSKNSITDNDILWFRKGR